MGRFRTSRVKRKPYCERRKLHGAIAVLVGGCLFAAVEAHSQTITLPPQIQALQGQFNATPVLHSNQPEIVRSEGILISTALGTSTYHWGQNQQAIANPLFTFRGPFGIHAHHIYRPLDASRMGDRWRRGLLHLGVIAINPSQQPVTVQFPAGMLRTSFDKTYLPTLMGVTDNRNQMLAAGPGDATALALLSGQRDWRIPQQVQLPPYSRQVLFGMPLPARGTANLLLRGNSSGPLQLALVASEGDGSEADFLRVLDNRELAQGRDYLLQQQQIRQRKLFSRVSGVAKGDTYQARVSADLTQPLHVPLTTTWRKHFGSQEVQVNPLLARMPDSSLENIGTYGVRYELTFQLRGHGPQRLLFTTPADPKPYTAFRGSLRLDLDGQVSYVHLGQPSGRTDTLYRFMMPASGQGQLKVSLVYPADASPGHILSIVPEALYAALASPGLEPPDPLLVEESERYGYSPRLPVVLSPATRPNRSSLFNGRRSTAFASPKGASTAALLAAERVPMLNLWPPEFP
jgi:hypothetical protein